MTGTTAAEGTLLLGHVLILTSPAEKIDNVVRGTRCQLEVEEAESFGRLTRAHVFRTAQARYATALILALLHAS
jgi:hypothetical protein